MKVLRSPNREETTQIMFFKNRGYGRLSVISIDSSYSSLLPDVRSRAPETAPVFIDQEESLKLRVFIDRSVVETVDSASPYVSIQAARTDRCIATLSRPGCSAQITRRLADGEHLVKLTSGERN